MQGVVTACRDYEKNNVTDNVTAVVVLVAFSALDMMIKRHGGRPPSELQSASTAICLADDTFITQLITDQLNRRNRKRLGCLRGFSPKDVARFRAYPR